MTRCHIIFHFSLFLPLLVSIVRLNAGNDRWFGRKKDAQVLQTIDQVFRISFPCSVWKRQVFVEPLAGKSKKCVVELMVDHLSISRFVPHGLLLACHFLSRTSSPMITKPAKEINSWNEKARLLDTAKPLVIFPSASVLVISFQASFLFETSKSLLDF